MVMLLEQLKTSPEAILREWGSAYVSEKYDGWRMIYDHGVFYTRRGNVINLHPSLYKQMALLPQDVIYDGELWMGYGTFSMIAGVDVETPDVTFKVFDIIGPDTFEKRLLKLQGFFKKIHMSSVHLVEHKRFTDEKDIIEYYDMIIHRGGEGIVLRNPKGLYESDTRSKNVLKKKPCERAELLVVGHYSTPASLAVGIVSSLICETIDGNRLKVTVHTKDPAPVGSVIVIEHSQFTVSGLPKFPRYIGIRSDADCEIVDEFKPRTPPKKTTTTTINRITMDSSKEKGYRGVFTTEELVRLGGASLERGSFILFDNGRGKLYKIAKARTSDHIYCSCEAWKFQRLPPVARTCKHCELAKGH